ncbi:hypothetical protein ACH5RR_028145 [Cinchona calisaya]|uniref:RRM domain-containing protein n=1 Tax=Cinchona calisaya TaxID=153742 RepID=A0ABD2YPW4_9GENT
MAFGISKQSAISTFFLNLGAVCLVPKGVWNDHIFCKNNLTRRRPKSRIVTSARYLALRNAYHLASSGSVQIKFNCLGSWNKTIPGKIHQNFPSSKFVSCLDTLNSKNIKVVSIHFGEEGVVSIEATGVVTPPELSADFFLVIANQLQNVKGLQSPEKTMPAITLYAIPLPNPPIYLEVGTLEINIQSFLFFLKCSNFFNAMELWLLDHSTSLTSKLEVNNHFTFEKVQSIIQPFSHDQPIKIVANAALHHPDVLDKILSIGRFSSVSGKLFVGSLGYDITSQILYHYFSLYGEIEEAFVVFDRATGPSKGYGLIFLKNVSSALLALKDPNKKMNDKSIVIKPGNVSRHTLTVERATDISAREVFVFNVPGDMTPGRLLEYFSSYGEIEKGPVGFDKTTGKPRGFAFFVYKTAEGDIAAVSNPSMTVDGHHFTCRMSEEWRNSRNSLVF